MEQNYCLDCGYFSVEIIAQEVGSPSNKAARRMGAVTWGGWQIAAGIIVVMISLFAAAAAAFAIGSLYPAQEDAVATWISVHLMGMAIVATAWYLGLRHYRDPLAVLRLSGVNWPRKRTVLLMFGVLAASLIATSIYSVIVEALGLDQFSTPEVESDIFFDGAAVLLTFQALAFITPMSEEIFFRGFIFRGLLPKMGPWGAITASALVFSAFHLSLGVMVPIFITGFLLAWLYWRTGSLWAAIGAHAGQNALALGVQALAG
jgi:membrane protease YdiL (CAAX protease family)